MVVGYHVLDLLLRIRQQARQFVVLDRIHVKIIVVVIFVVTQDVHLSRSFIVTDVFLMENVIVCEDKVMWHDVPHCFAGKMFVADLPERSRSGRAMWRIVPEVKSQYVCTSSLGGQ
jgi:hypothetical protein